MIVRRESGFSKKPLLLILKRYTEAKYSKLVGMNYAKREENLQSPPLPLSACLLGYNKLVLAPVPAIHKRKPLLVVRSQAELLNVSEPWLLIWKIVIIPPTNIQGCCEN